MIFKQKPRIIYNDDNCGLRVIPPPHTTGQISSVVDYMRNSQVDCVCWLMAEEIAYSYHSSVLENIYDLYERDPDFVPVNKSLEKNLPLTLYKQGVDYLPLLIDQFHDAGISFYGSIRMNDAHHKSKPDGWLASEFWKKHQDWRLWEVEDGFGYYNAPLDYSYPEVRNLKIETVREILELYNVDGIELDFCRNPYTFQPSEAWEKRQILTDFVFEIRKLINEYSGKKGHDIGLIIRVPFKDEKLKLAGMDIRQWLEDGLPDILSMSYLSNNYNACIEPWSTMCRKHGVLFYPSVESGAMTNPYPKTVLPHNVLPPKTNYNMSFDIVKSVRGMAQNYLAQGADGIYMFNYPCSLFENERDTDTFAELISVLSEAGSKATLEDKDKQYIFCHDLPIYVEANRPAKYHQTIKFHVNESLLEPEHKVSLSFRRVAAQNPHSYIDSIGPVLPVDYMQTILNGRILDEENFIKAEDEMEMIPSGFHNIGKHEKIKINLNGNDLIYGENTLQFYIPHFPCENDPYVYIYELIVETSRS